MARLRRFRGRSRPRLTGVSVILAGAQWDYTESERDIVHDLIVFLSAKSVMTAPYELEQMQYVRESLVQVRDEMTATLQRLSESAKSALLVEEMREAVSTFLLITGKSEFTNAFEMAHLGALRGTVLATVRVLADKFGFDIRGRFGEALVE